MLISLIVVITSQCIHVSKHLVKCLKYIQFLHVNYTSTKLLKDDTPNSELPNYFTAFTVSIKAALEAVSLVPVWWKYYVIVCSCVSVPNSTCSNVTFVA